MKKTKIKYSRGLIFFFSCALIFNCAPGGAFAEDANMDNPFGVLEFLHWNHDWNNYKYPNEAALRKALKSMKAAGIGWVRMDFLWTDIEPKQGEFDFSDYDRIVDTAVAEGVSILGIFDYGNTWSSESGQWNVPPRENKPFVDYAVEVIRRYKDRVKYWELWNEPDSGVYWAPQDGLSRYCELLKEVYVAAKQADPDCKILNGGFSNPGMGVSRLYENGCKDYFDIMNIHIFVSPFNPVGLKAVTAYVRQTSKKMAQYGDENKKIWITEIGCPGVPPDVQVSSWWMGKNPSERFQAGWVEGVYPALLSTPGVEKIFWAFFRDTQGHWGNGVDHFGLVRWDFSRKPAYFSYKKIFEDWKKQCTSPTDF